MTEEPTIQERTARLEAEIAELSARFPRHSVAPAFVLRLEELEDSLAELRSRLPDTLSSDERP